MLTGSYSFLIFNTPSREQDSDRELFDADANKGEAACNCSSFRAPKITEHTVGLWSNQLSAICGTVFPGSKTGTFSPEPPNCRNSIQ